MQLANKAFGTNPTKPYKKRQVEDEARPYEVFDSSREKKGTKTETKILPKAIHQDVYVFECKISIHSVSSLNDVLQTECKL